MSTVMLIPTSNAYSTNGFRPYPLEPMVEHWILRLLIVLDGQRYFIYPDGICHHPLAKALGLTDWLDLDYFQQHQKNILPALTARLDSIERELGDIRAPLYLHKNIERIAPLVGLSEVDCKILAFTILIHTDQLLDGAAGFMGMLNSNQTMHLLAGILDCSNEDIRSALEEHGALTRSGLASIERSDTSTLKGKLSTLSEDFADSMISLDADPISLLRGVVDKAPEAQLTLNDYSHIESLLAVLKPYLSHAVRSGRTGVNIFIYGAPGTGKTQLARALAQDMCCELFEVASEDQYHGLVGARVRLRAYRIAQSFFARRRALIVFDEAEDIFSNGATALAQPSASQSKKAWINRTLEENAIPTIWLANSIDSLDPAFVRRFDMIFELGIPSKSVRRQIIENVCGGLLPDSAKAQLSAEEHLAPAVVTRTAAVINTVCDQLGEAETAKAFELIVRNTLIAQGHAPKPNKRQDEHAAIYDTDFIQADADLQQISAGLVAANSGQICLYGPSGTGKTAYGHWLAEQLDRPLICKRVSDLMSRYVGDSEKNIAQAFRQAELENAVLMIDEVDSFLQDRRQAKRSWESSVVNEMLTQMESYAGVFIASTNLMDGLDQAVLRRFDVKVKFDYLSPEKAWALFDRHCQLMAFENNEALRPTLQRLNNLTPGDFATVMRLSRFKPITSGAGLIAALAAECEIKEGLKPTIGFRS